jgi:hypothetical protein
MICPDFGLHPNNLVQRLAARAGKLIMHVTTQQPVLCRLLEHDPEKACPGLDPGWTPVFGKDHAPRTS